MKSHKKPLTQHQAAMLATNKLIIAHQEGFDAGFHSLKVTNPYPSDCLEHNAWVDGKKQGIEELKGNL